MSTYYALLTFLIPLLTHVNPTHSRSGIDCSLTPSSCPTITNTTLASLSKKPGDLEPIPPIPPHKYGGLCPATATGDVLNTTRCYCASPSWKDDHIYGYYYLISYYNFHHNSIYKLAMTCSSEKITKVSLPYHDNRLQPECLRVHSHDRVCQHADDKGNTKGTFCYEFNGATTSDYYYFNKQKRGIPIGGVWREGAERTLEICEDRCMHDVGRLHVLDGEALDAIVDDPKGVGPGEWSRMLSWGDTDDMCETCE